VRPSAAVYQSFTLLRTRTRKWHRLDDENKKTVIEEEDRFCRRH